MSSWERGEIIAGGDKRGDGIADLHMLELLQEALTYGPSSGITLVLADCKLPVHLENKSLRNFSCTSLYQIKSLARNTFLAPLNYRLEYSWIEIVSTCPYLGKQCECEKKRGDVGSWQIDKVYWFALDLHVSQVLWFPQEVRDQAVIRVLWLCHAYHPPFTLFFIQRSVVRF